MDNQPRLFAEPEPEYHPLFEESERQRQIRRASELWMRYIPEELHYGECVFMAPESRIVMGKLVESEREARGHINGIDCHGRCIVLERNPAYRPGTKDDCFRNTWWILPENVKRIARGEKANG